MEYIDLIQWPAMVATFVAAWLVASQKKRKREFGFRHTQGLMPGWPGVA
jgi:hypothetical protein